MPRIVETQVYEFHELSDAAKEKARDWFREGVGDYDWHEFIIEDFEEICRILGVELTTRPVRLMGGGTRQKPCIYFSGFYSQGDGACFEGTYTYEKGAARRIRDYAPQDRELHAIADRLFEVQRANFFQLRAEARHRGHYCHAYCMEIAVWRDSPGGQEMTDAADDAVTESLRDLANWLYRQLEREWEYMMSDDYGVRAGMFLENRREPLDAEPLELVGGDLLCPCHTETGSRPRRLRKLRMSPLLHPARRQRPLQLLQHQRLIGRPGEDSLDEVWRQQREAQNPVHVRLPDRLRLPDLA